mmetsp:Transcript_13111/g.31079  ORF Transcript_13111/g.31079 Transcript_13111/m.31079 type:complete len:253 (+) Transcript_13111:797-1555(+)
MTREELSACTRSAPASSAQAYSATSGRLSGGLPRHLCGLSTRPRSRVRGPFCTRHRPPSLRGGAPSTCTTCRSSLPRHWRRTRRSRSSCGWPVNTSSVRWLARGAAADFQPRTSTICGLHVRVHFPVGRPEPVMGDVGSPWHLESAEAPHRSPRAWVIDRLAATQGDELDARPSSCVFPFAVCPVALTQRVGPNDPHPLESEASPAQSPPICLRLRQHRVFGSETDRDPRDRSASQTPSRTAPVCARVVRSK